MITVSDDFFLLIDQALIQTDYLKIVTGILNNYRALSIIRVVSKLFIYCTATISIAILNTIECGYWLSYGATMTSYDLLISDLWWSATVIIIDFLQNYHNLNKNNINSNTLNIVPSGVHIWSAGILIRLIPSYSVAFHTRYSSCQLCGSHKSNVNCSRSSFCNKKNFFHIQLNLYIENCQICGQICILATYLAILFFCEHLKCQIL